MMPEAPLTPKANFDLCGLTDVSLDSVQREGLYIS